MRILNVMRPVYGLANDLEYHLDLKKSQTDPGGKTRQQNKRLEKCVTLS